MKHLQKNGKGAVESTDQISDSDFRILMQYFRFFPAQKYETTVLKMPFMFRSVIETPVGLLRFVFFSIQFFMLRRGRENLALLKVSEFKVEEIDGNRIIKHV